MIKIKPYEGKTNEGQILTYYLNLVAEVVPFMPDDVLYDKTKMYKDIGKKPRTRNKEYVELLKKEGIPDGKEPDERRKVDAYLAEVLISKYSAGLHEKLYGSDKIVGGTVEREALRDLLTVSFDHGKLPEGMNWHLAKQDSKKKKDITKKLLKYVFRYDAFSEVKIPHKGKKNDKRPNIYQLIAMLGVDVCPYCNRQFTSTVVNGNRQVRPQIDHFRNKSTYPFLALSINNLVPSCAVCNLLKHDDDRSILYPYDEGLDDNFAFQAECEKDNIVALLTGAKDAEKKFSIKLIERKRKLDDGYAERVKTSMDILALDDLYQFHKGYVADLFRQRYMITKKLYEDMEGQFGEWFNTENEKHSVRLMDYSQENWSKRPLAKLTHDISEQMDELYEDDEVVQQLLALLGNEDFT